MSSREKILKAIKQNKPEEIFLENFSFTSRNSQDLTSFFQTTLESIGGKCMLIDHQEALSDYLQEELQKQEYFINGIEYTSGYNLDTIQNCEAKDLQSVYTTVIKGKLGVAENGAVWVSEENLGHRILPFICQRLMLVLEEDALVATMHDAYERLVVDQEGYGVFIAGPSKTADIEQSLVIGAHGPITMQVLIIKK